MPKEFFDTILAIAQDMKGQIMIDVNHIIERNHKELSRLLSIYEIKYSIDHLVNKMKTIYVNVDKESQRLRLLGVEKQFYIDTDFDSETGITYTAEKEIKDTVKKAQIYVMKKRDYEKIEDGDKNRIMRELDIIVNLISELQTIKEIEIQEENWTAPMYKLHLSEEFFNVNI